MLNLGSPDDSGVIRLWLADQPDERTSSSASSSPGSSARLSRSPRPGCSSPSPASAPARSRRIHLRAGGTVPDSLVDARLRHARRGMAGLRRELDRRPRGRRRPLLRHRPPRRRAHRRLTLSRRLPMSSLRPEVRHRGGGGRPSPDHPRRGRRARGREARPDRSRDRRADRTRDRRPSRHHRLAHRRRRRRLERHPLGHGAPTGATVPTMTSGSTRRPG